MIEVTLRKTERIDELNERGYRIIQDTEGFCFGLDAVLLTSFSIVREGDHVLDLGSGTGVIPILLEAKTKGASFTGLELQEDVAEMANRSTVLNGIEKKVHIVTGDIREAASIFGKGKYEVVTSNPPYMKASNGFTSPNERKAISRTEIKCTLDDVVRSASELLKMNGRFYMVHRPERLSEIMDCFNRYKLTVRNIRFVHPFADKDANMVLIEGIKGSRANVIVEKPLVVYKAVSEYTDEVSDIYYREQLMTHKNAF